MVLENPYSIRWDEIFPSQIQAYCQGSLSGGTFVRQLYALGPGAHDFGCFIHKIIKTLLIILIEPHNLTVLLLWRGIR